MEPEESFDALVVGGGPGGLTAALYLARFLRRVVLYDSGQSRASLISSSYNYPGFTGGVSGPALLSRLREQAQTFGAVLRDGRVTAVRRTEAGDFIATAGGQTLRAPALVLATGIVDRAPGLPSLKSFVYEGGVRFCPVCDGYEARGKRIGVMGPLPKVISKALFLRAYSPDIVLLPVGPDLSCRPEDEARLKGAGLSLPESPLADIIAGDPIRAVMADGRRLDVDVLYPFMGAEVRTELAHMLGATANDEGCLHTDSHQQTTVPGLYAVGDITLDLSQISVAVGQAAIAATAIHNSLPVRYA